MNKKICVVGGSGFLGSHVADALTTKNYQVVIFDSQSSKWIGKYQDFIYGDISDIEAISQAIKGCYAVYNFAAISDLDDVKNKPIESIRVNVLGNVNVMEASVQNDVKHYIYASSAYVFSREGGFYRCSKQASELYVEEYSKKYGLQYTILRYGSLYGPRSGVGNGLFRVIENAINYGEVTYIGSKESLREYIHVEDAAFASVAALEGEFKNQSVMLTGQEPMRVLDLLEMLREILNIKKPVNFKEASGEGHYIRTPYSYQPKSGKKYIPSTHVDLGQGLLQTIEYIDSTKSKRQHT